ncbi:doxorubicin resistance ABC transporter permease protein DrrB [Mycolicibacterium madagascariense]|uniref:Doxorubicin resistance ABC transporter permease protein DrrB n=1 Tax=Mycolicibacterium madagascariense TaxID=212765 RepID=A0A7I7X9Y7_9MYCO|nr:ABC transporter permease [Mycolicibacterium madagascariense]MCV7012913.1 ABC transporter permease [Mycolicibacterium madagascariense]BBZ26160.1 doxorubicin resistance ABC transporter permease protein DrrB [Mycolicibacterium madagascariense]
MNAIALLTGRILVSSRLDLVFAIVAPLIGLVGFTLLLRNVIATGQMSYSQYVLPAVVVQAMLFGALTTTDRAAFEKASGMSLRLRTLPISPYAGLSARMSYSAIRGTLALVASVVGAYLLGFRFTTGIGYAAAFVVLSLTLTLALSLGADATGAKAGRTEVASQLLLVPQLLLVLLSTGMAPLDSFPGWLHPFVRYQPISQITETLRGFTSGHVDAANLATSLGWCVALLAVCGTAAIRLQGRRE